MLYVGLRWTLYPLNTSTSGTMPLRSLPPMVNDAVSLNARRVGPGSWVVSEITTWAFRVFPYSRLVSCPHRVVGYKSTSRTVRKRWLWNKSNRITMWERMETAKRAQAKSCNYLRGKMTSLVI